MPGLINAELATIGQAECGEDAPALISRFPADLRSAGTEVGKGRVDVVAHQVELVMVAVPSRVDGQFGRRQREDRPAIASVNRGEAEGVSKIAADFFGLWRENDGVHSGNHVSMLEPSAATRRR